MSMILQESPEAEQRIGIRYYAATTEGIGGTIKTQPADFVVREVTNRTEGTEGKYLIAELTKTNWDTHTIAREISRRLRVSRNRIGFAGTKDKFAVTTQKISLWDTAETELERVRITDVSLRPIGRSNRSVSLGDLYGNEFVIVIRNVDGAQAAIQAKIDAITAELKAAGGVPNYFGVQRFGTNRPITHLVGKLLISNDLKGAIMTYIGKIFPEESAEAKAARALCNQGELKACLKQMPIFLRYERAMLNELIKNAEGDRGESQLRAAFSVLPKNLQKLFVHAYQAYLFNLMVSQRLERGLPFNEAVIGDVVCYHDERGIPDPERVERVTAEKLEGINRLIRHGRAFVTAPLVGSATEFDAGEVGELERAVLSDEQVSPEQFELETLPELSSKGSRRPLLVPVTLSVPEVSADELKPDRLQVRLAFFLPRGAYATVVLREYVKH
ncbi:MAG: tRNA pseudouridine(13) synthase TruD [Candidatus Methanospirareceae archaeon]